ncbi:MAG TPA: CpsD/CapB family tyrosine-protein kinase [Ktedonobacteraceae bacterium]|nr:CpsD/CapB family tyrosine-protein kinase [Ktedonobacteraceae bacterium]
MSDDTSSAGRSSKLVPYKTFLLRWGWFIALAMLVTTITTAFVPDAQYPPTYQAMLLIQAPRPGNFSLPTTASQGATGIFYTNYFVSAATLSLVLPKYKDLQLSDLQSMVSVVPVIGTNVVQLIADGNTPQEAIQLVNDVYRAGTTQVNEQRFKLDQELIDNLNKELVQAKQDAADSFGTLQSLIAANQVSSFAYVQINSQYKEQLQRIDNINKQLLTLQQQIAGRNNGILQVIGNAPQVTTIPSSPATTGQRLALSPLVGLIMALGGILLANTFSNRLPLRKKKQEAVQAKIAAVIAPLPLRAGRVEALRQVSPCLALFRHLHYWASEQMQELHIITVTGPGERDGKSTVATGLALAAAQSGVRTLLVDANPQHPVLHDWFNLPNEVGTLDRVHACAAGATVALFEQQTIEQHLSLLPIGSQPLSADILADPLRLNGLRPLISLLRQQADLIIFDAPALLDDAGATNLAQLSDITLLVVDAQRSARTSVAEAEHLLATTGIPSTIVINRARPEIVE